MKNANTTNRPVPNPGRTRTRPQTQGASLARREAAQATKRPAGRPAGTQAKAVSGVGALPISAHRLIASVVLAVLLLTSLIGPSGVSVPKTAALLSPNADGSNSLPGAATTSAAENELFRYLSVVERNQGDKPVVPDNVADILHSAPSSVRSRETIIGQMFTSSSGSLDQALVDTGFFSNLDAQKLDDIETIYRSFLNDEQRGSRALNGLGVMALYRSLGFTGSERAFLEGTGLSGMQQAIDASASTWQFTYNYSLANLMMGNYASAYEAMRGISSTADAAGNKMTPFWLGVAALRMGDPALAETHFRSLVDLQVTGGNQAYQDQLTKLRNLAREGLADAQWANQETTAAYSSYYNILANTNTDDMGLYNKWVRLGMQQRAYERLVSDMQGLESGSGLSGSPRLHHDRARILTFLGRTAEAENEYKQAIQVGENDPSLLVSYGQFLEAKGDHSGALTQASDAVRGLGVDPVSSDLTTVAHAVALTTTAPADLYSAEQLLDANLLRARAWGSSGKQDQAGNLASNVALGAQKAPGNEAGLLNLYAGFAAEAAGLNDKAVGYYDAAWAKLKGQPSGTQGRGAALTGLARTTAATKDAAAGIAVLATNGYDPAAPKQELTVDTDAPDILYQGAQLLTQAGKKPEAANALRVSSILRNTQDARTLDGVGRPMWEANGTSVPASSTLEAADALSAVGGSANSGAATLRYSQAFLLDPALSAAWNNLGVAYANQGNSTLASYYLNRLGSVSPDYALGSQNRASLAYKQGIGNFFNAEAAQADAIKVVGPSGLFSDTTLKADTRGPFPAPLPFNSDLLARVPAILMILLLLAHTLVGNDRLTNRMGLLPTKGVLGMAAAPIDTALKDTVPGAAKPTAGSNALLLTILIPSIIGMLALAWSAGHGSLGVALVYLPVAFLVSAIAFAANRLAVRWMAARHHGSVVSHLWPFGLVLGVIGIPFGFLYGWQAVTRLQPAGATADGVDGKGQRRARSGEALDLEYEAQAEAAADMPLQPGNERTGTATTPGLPTGGLFSLSPGASIFFAGLAANLVLAVIFGAIYWFTAWPSMRLAMYASVLVLAFTAVSEPPADGWTLYRRNAPLWLAVFTLASAAAVLLALGIM